MLRSDWTYVKCKCLPGAQADGAEAAEGVEEPGDDRRWLVFNDSHVGAVEESEVLSTAAGGGGGSASAYMLVYAREDKLAELSSSPQ